MYSGPSPDPVKLVTQDKAHSLQVAMAGAKLSLMGPGSTLLWSPLNALPGNVPAQLCITSQAELQLNGSAPGPASLWSTAFNTKPASNGPYTAEITSEGCLDILDGRCQLVWSSHDGARTRKSPPAAAAGTSSGTRSRPPRVTGALPSGSNSSAAPPKARVDHKVAPPVPRGRQSATPAPKGTRVQHYMATKDPPSRLQATSCARPSYYQQQQRDNVAAGSAGTKL